MRANERADASRRREPRVQTNARAHERGRVRGRGGSFDRVERSETSLSNSAVIMGGIRGKSAKKRARMAGNSKTFDRISGTFYDEKASMPSKKISDEAMKSAPKSFRRFLAAKAAAEQRMHRRDRGEEEVLNEPSTADARRNSGGDASGTSSEEEDDKEVKVGPPLKDTIVPLVRAKPDKGDERLKAMDERAQAVAAEAEKKKKKKHLSLRERRKKERAFIRAQKEEEEEFIRGTGGSVRFGEVAEAPPTITLKRKSGGKGDKEVPIEQSGQKIVEIAENKSGGKSNRQSKIFADLMASAQGASEKKKQKVASQGLRRQAELAELRAQVIADYRSMKGRPMNNGRNEKLANNPVKLFTIGTSIVSPAQLRTDRRGA